MRNLRSVLVVALLFTLAACGETIDDGPVASDGEPLSDEEIALLENEAEIGFVNEPGSYKGDDFFHNGEEDFSENCKPIPDLEPLVDPEIVISLDGLTLHLRDRAGTYERTFPIGPGRIGSSGNSLTPVSTSAPGGVFWARADKPPVIDSKSSASRKWAWNYACRIWSGKKYYNPVTGRKEYRSYFAGLPFIRLEGPPSVAYGIHGPISNYWREDGGDLKRGFVSGGCIRMEDDDLVELYARILGHKVPVRVQHEIERDASGLAVDADRFVNSECATDADCADEGAVCQENPLSGRSYCTVPCERTRDCPTRPFDLESYCVADPLSNDGSGTCLVESDAQANKNCERYGQFRAETVSAMDDASISVEVCMPSGEKWIGETCSLDAECATNTCLDAGICSQSCDGTCPDRPGEPLTRCVASPDGEGGACVASCKQDSDCPTGHACQEREFFGRSGSDNVCVPL